MHVRRLKTIILHIFSKTLIIIEITSVMRAKWITLYTLL